MKIAELITEQSTLTELTRPKNTWVAADILAKAGYKHAGSGRYAEVYSKPGADHVLKLFSADDTGYQDFVKFASTSNNPHFPKFKGKMMKVTDNYYAIRMEKLTPLTGDTDDLITFVNTYLRFYPTMSVDAYKNRLHKEAQKLEKTQPGIIDALNQLLKHVPANSYRGWDIHVGNIMMRGDTRVIIDPIISW